MFNRLRSISSSNGQSTVEFALVLPVLLALMFGVMEFGRGLYAYNALANAAREGARYGIISPTDAAGIKSRVTASAVALGLAASDVTVTYPDGAATTGNRIHVRVAYVFQPTEPFVGPSFAMNSSATLTIQ